MEFDFVERRPEGLYIRDSRVPLAMIVREFEEGQSAEAIQQDHPTLSLATVYGAIAFHLVNRTETETDCTDGARLATQFAATHRVPGELGTKLVREARHLPAHQP